MQRDESFAAVVASVGVVGEAVVLWHELVHTYPFKIFTYPPPEFFERLGNVVAIAVAVVFVALAFWTARRLSWATPPIITFSAPLVFAASVAAVTVVRFGTQSPSGFRNFDGYTIGQALREFGSEAFLLSLGGLVVGGLCSLIVVVLRRRQVAAA